MGLLTPSPAARRRRGKEEGDYDDAGDDDDDDDDRLPPPPAVAAAAATQEEEEGGGGLPPPEVRILVEIVSARDLPGGSPVSSSSIPGGRARVVVRAAPGGGPVRGGKGGGGGGGRDRDRGRGEVLHRTRPASAGGSSDPVWTVRTGSLCLLDVRDVAGFGRTGGIEFEVLSAATAAAATASSSPSPSSFSRLCCTVSPSDVLEGRGGRIELPLGRGGVGGSLALRFRRATASDVGFLRAARGGGEEIGDDAAAAGGPADFAFRQARPPRSHRRRRRVAAGGGGGGKGWDGKEGGEVLVRVQPRPDPSRPGKTEWMAPAAIEAMVREPSSSWVRVGGGGGGGGGAAPLPLGILHVEVLGCDGLPNMDELVRGRVGALPGGDKTDAFAALLYEDTFVRTDVIFDRLGPRWPPWSMRAFAYPIRHPGSPLVFGVFDYDEGPLQAHDPIGRVVVSLAQLAPDTVYDLTYALTSGPAGGEGEEEGKGAGTVTLRLRVEYPDERAALLRSFAPPPAYHVNCRGWKAYQVCRYLCRGRVDMGRATSETCALYARELMSYGGSFAYAADVVLGVLLWRGEWEVGGIEEGDRRGGGWSSKGRRRKIWFPLPSAALFLAAVVTIERPQLLPAAVLLGAAAIMASVGSARSRHPLAFDRCRSIGEVTAVLALGRHRPRRPVSIEPNAGIDEARALAAVAGARAERIAALLAAVQAAGLRFYREYYKTDAGALSIETEDSGGWNLLGPYLYYVHLALSYLCGYARALANLATWRSPRSYFLARALLVAGLAALLVPWGGVLRWTARIVAWTLLGPWMAILDARVVRPHYRTEAELAADPASASAVPDVGSLFAGPGWSELARRVRIAFEDSLKLRDMREIRFGRYSSRVPTVDGSRFPSVPLPASAAWPYLGEGRGRGEYLPEEECTYRYLPGQRLLGSMIHVREGVGEAGSGMTPATPKRGRPPPTSKKRPGTEFSSPGTHRNYAFLVEGGD